MTQARVSKDFFHAGREADCLFHKFRFNSLELTLLSFKITIFQIFFWRCGSVALSTLLKNVHCYEQDFIVFKLI